MNKTFIWEGVEEQEFWRLKEQKYDKTLEKHSFDFY